MTHVLNQSCDPLLPKICLCLLNGAVPNLNELNQKYERMSASGYLQTENRFQYYL